MSHGFTHVICNEIFLLVNYDFYNIFVLFTRLTNGYKKRRNMVNTKPRSNIKALVVSIISSVFCNCCPLPPVFPVGGVSTVTGRWQQGGGNR